MENLPFCLPSLTSFLVKNSSLKKKCFKRVSYLILFPPTVLREKFRKTLKGRK